MKTSKARTKMNDWQKADARVLGQILAAQNIDFVLPDSTRLAEFFAETLIGIPAIKACRVCLYEVSIQRGEMETEICKSCKVMRERDGKREKFSSFEPGFQCDLATQSGMQFNAIVSPYHHFGFFIFQVDNLDVFNVYKPFINNLANYVALSLENRQQKDLLQKARDELENKVAERTEELRASNEVIKDLYNNAPCGYHSLDKDGLIILINDTELRWLGYSRDEIIGKVRFQDFLTSSSLKLFEEKFPIFKDQGWVSDLEFEIVRKDGTLLPVLLNATAIKDSDGNYVMSRSTIFDNTERKRADLALHESEERFRSFVEEANDIVYTVSTDGVFTYVSPNWKEMLGHEASEVVGKSFEVFVHPDDLVLCRDVLNRTVLSGERQSGFEYRVKHKNGSWQWHTSNSSVIRDGDGNVVSFLGIARNITERKRNERELIVLNRAINQSSDAVFLINEQLTFAYVNDAACRSLGYTREELLTMGPSDIDAVITSGEAKDILDKQFSNDSYPIFETRHKMRDGRTFPVEIGSSVVEYDGAKFSLTTVRDITERKQAEISLQEREKHSQSLLRLSRKLEQAETYAEVMNSARDEVQAVIGYQNLWAYLFTPDKKQAKVLFAKGPVSENVMSEDGVATLTVQGDRMMEEIVEAREIVVVEDARTDERTDKKIVERLGNRTLVNIPILLFDRHMGSVGVGTFGDEGILVPTASEQEYLKALASHMAVTLDRIHLLNKRRQAEQSLRESEEKYRALAENIPNVVFQCKNDLRYTFVYLNSAIENLTGYTKEDFLENGLSFFDLYHPDDLKTMPTPEENNVTDINRNPFHVTYRIRHKSGEWRWVDEWGTGIMGSDGKVEYLEGIMVNITERKQHERERETIISVSTALRKVATRTEILNIILDQLVDLFDSDGAMLVLPNPQAGGFIDEMGRGSVAEKMIGLNIPQGMGVCNWVVINKKPYLNNHADSDPFFYRSDLLGDSHCLASVPLIAQDHAIGALWIARKVDILEQDVRLLNAIADIAANAIHRVMLHEQTVSQLHHLIALHQIDIAISSNFDLNLTLDVILHNVKSELEVDAADILMLNPITHTLGYVAGQGFRTHGIEQSHVRIVDEHAGKAAREHRTVSCSNLKLAQDSFSRFSLLADEEFVMHFATPLVVKGQVKGVLELFHRKAFETSSDWLDYFETLATQAAIAIESASLLESLQRSNAELKLSYDVTIEGWSRALDLRDKETEGHAQRVAEMALALAEKMGMSDAEKQHLWRGALLHDIGKMGVPDSILHKPGPLSEIEQEIMRQHPIYAYQMLSPIIYLKPALDIPYCHHERWDGSGYPRGLKGEDIPLSARLFAVVDVFDALTSDRPYRKAWTHETVYRYIEGQSGKHFDPQIVKIFLAQKYL